MTAGVIFFVVIFIVFAYILGGSSKEKGYTHKRVKTDSETSIEESIKNLRGISFDGYSNHNTKAKRRVKTKRRRSNNQDNLDDHSLRDMNYINNYLNND